MRVHILTTVFPPEPVTSAYTNGGIAEELAKRGHDVTVFTSFPNRPTGTVLTGYHRTWRSIEQRDGYRIVRAWHTLSRRSTVVSRISENISSGSTSTLSMMREPAPDVAYVDSWPVFARWLNIFTLSRRKVPIVSTVKDLYPETLLDATRVSRTSPLFRVIRAIDNQTYEWSELVTVLNTTQREYLVADRGVSPEKVRVCGDGVDASHFPMNPLHHGAFREQRGLSSDVFLAMYVGSLTRMAGLDLYLEVADRLRDRDDIRLLLVGDGAMRMEVEAAVAARHLDNLQVIHPLSPEDVPGVQAAADVLLLSLLPGAATHTTPSKLLFYMFSARPVLASVELDGPPAKVINDARCGYVIAQGDADQFAKKLAEMADNRSSLVALGQNARRYADVHFSREVALPRVCDLIESVGNHH